MAFNSYSAGERIAGWNAGLNNVRTSLGGGAFTAIATASAPTVDQSGRYAYLLGGAHSELRLGGSVIDRWTNGIIEPFVATQGLVWNRMQAPRQTFGWRGAGVEALGRGLTDEFHPVVIDTPSGPWLLYHSHTSCSCTRGATPPR